MELADLDTSKIYTYADYMKWAFDERLELIKGKIFPMSPRPGYTHQRLSGSVFFRIYSFLQGSPCKVLSAPFDVRLYRKSVKDQDILTVVQPDIFVVCDPSKIEERGCLGAPDIVIEILSPGNNKRELQNKYEVYEEAGVKEYWIVHPHEKTLLKYTLNNQNLFVPSRLLTLGDVVTTPVLPGFNLILDEVFEGV